MRLMESHNWYPLSILLALAATIAVQTGCEKFAGPTEGAASEFRLPQPAMEPNSVALAIGIAELELDQKNDFEDLVAKADWLDMDLEHRRRLDENGLAVALVPGSATNDLDELLAAPIAGKSERRTSRLKSHRRVESHFGEGIVAAVSSPVAQLHWDEYVDGQTYGESADLAHGAFRITAFPVTADQVRLTFTPEVHHGMKKSWIGVENRAFAFEQRQAFHSLERLSFEVVVGKNDTILICPTVAMERLGKVFFDGTVDPATGDQERSLQNLFPMLDDETTNAETTQQDEAVLEKDVWQRILIVRLVDSKIDH